MFIDASAVVSVLAREPDHKEIIDRIVESQTQLAVSPLVRIEAVLAVARAKRLEADIPTRSQAVTEECNRLFDKLMERINAEEIAINAAIGRSAVMAYAKYGKGCGHPARLDLVDCFSYACAKTLGVGLIYKGDDFAKTDLA